MRRTVLVQILILVVAMALLALWCDYRARTLSERAVLEQQQKDFEFWRARLLPVYREMEIEHDEKPTTKEELFDPLIELFSPLEKR